LSLSNIGISGNVIFNICGGNITNLSKISADVSNNIITTTHRLYQEISGDISWSAVNGYYGLAKDAYPGITCPDLTRTPISTAETAIISWVPRTSAEANDWRSICWSPELQLFAAVAYSGTNNRVMTSPDGINWTARSSPTSGWICVCWSPERLLFVAISESGTNRIMTSPDGTTWTARSIPTGEISNAWFSVCWSPQRLLFVAVALSGTNRVMTSPNGTTWTAVFAGTDADFLGVCWSPQSSLFVAVAGSGAIRVKTSPDGTTWTSQSSVETAYELRNVCWSPERSLFVAVANEGRIITSPNGTTWTTRLVVSLRTFNISWSSEIGIFTALVRQTNYVITSPDGINWTPILIPQSNNWWGICSSPQLGIFAAVSADGTNRVMTSRPAVYSVTPNWTPRVSSNETNGWMSVCWSGELGLFVAVSINGTNRVMTSPNGITWTGRTSPLNAWRSVCWSNTLGIFVAVAAGGTNGVITSPDGITWTGRTAPSGNNWYGVCWSAELGLFVAVGETGSNRVMTSPNGITWTGRVSGNEANTWRSVCWSPERALFVAVANGGSNRVMTSPNGTTWTARPSSNETNEWRSVCWSKELGLFVATAHFGTNKVMTSPNGITWTGRRAGDDNRQWRSVCWSAELGLFVAIAESTNIIMTSNNGINWTVATGAIGQGWISICWSKELGIFAAVAEYGTAKVMTSSLKGRPPTSYNLFDSTYNSIDEAGTWTFSNLNSITLRANGSTVTSDDRLKHNEININNGLNVIDQLCPKIYQKTQTMLDEHYNGDLSGYIWKYEAGIIAQELLQINDLSFVVGGGDFYDAHYNIQEKPYNVNYNAVFTYGLAAIKELHAKVKVQETTILDEESSINNLMSRIEALENKP
jgi:hypothetical protein